MSLITKPMLAANAPDLDSLTYPIGASVKIDGIRALMVGGRLVSRTFKPIKNDHIRTTLESILPDGIDGEIIVPGGTFQDATSAVMSVGGSPDFVFFAFDYVKDDLRRPYSNRVDDLVQWHREFDASYPEYADYVYPILPAIIENSEQLLAFENKCIDDGWEGVILRDFDGPYKCGRSTANEGYLLKVKRFEDAEAEVIGFEEQMHNMNEAKKDNFGRTERSSHKENKVPAGVLGKFIVRDLETGIEFGVGTGLTQAQREEFWSDKDNMIGKVIKYKSFKIGVKEAPRHPVFLGFRDKSDM